ncbi:MAG: replication-associated recombination protein A, partial [Candidatus Omnitrophica bacterium]|nr:replication-associated recombination protein A [Candidatus Omnitrophota bacterium]
GRGGYKYAHNYKGHFVEQEYLPSTKKYYHPTGLGYEKVIKERLQAASRKPQVKGQKKPEA